MEYTSKTLTQEQQAQEIANELRFLNDACATNKEFKHSLMNNPIGLINFFANEIDGEPLSWTLGIIEYTEKLTGRIYNRFSDTPSAQRIIRNW